MRCPDWDLVVRESEEREEAWEEALTHFDRCSLCRDRAIARGAHPLVSRDGLARERRIRRRGAGGDQVCGKHDAPSSALPEPTPTTGVRGPASGRHDRPCCFPRGFFKVWLPPILRCPGPRFLSKRRPGQCMPAKDPRKPGNRWGEPSI